MFNVNVYFHSMITISNIKVKSNKELLFVFLIKLERCFALLLSDPSSLPVTQADRSVVNFANILRAVLRANISNTQKDSQIISVFLHFWDLRAQKLLIKCWWNWLLLSISPTFYKQLLGQYIFLQKNYKAKL